MILYSVVVPKTVIEFFQKSGPTIPEKMQTTPAMNVPSLTPLKQGKSSLSKKYSSKVQKKKVIETINQEKVK